MSAPEPGGEFAGFAIEDELGRGGMGVVFRARESTLDRTIALKVIRSDLAHDPDFRRRFESESRTAALIEHPNVVPIYGAGEIDGVIYLAMRLVEGRDLHQQVRSEGPPPPEEATRVVAAAADGLDAVHAAGLIHRDVKPGNILLGRGVDEARVFITDFGLAKAAASTTQLTGSGQFIGTLDYVAPEQLQGERADARTDVYALGCVLFFALTGEVPFPQSEGSAKMYAHVHGTRPSLAERGFPQLAVFQAVIDRALATDPEDRFPSAGDLGRAAQAALQGDAPTRPERVVGVGDAAPAAPTRPMPTEVLVSPKRRRRVLLGAALALMLAIVAAGLVALEPFANDQGPSAEREGRGSVGGAEGSGSALAASEQQPAPECSEQDAFAELDKRGLLEDGLPRPSRVVCVDLNDDGVEEMAVTRSSVGSAGTVGWGIFVAADDGSWDLPIFEADETHVGIKAEDGYILRGVPVYAPGDANCCPTGGFEIQRYTLSGGEVELVDTTTKKGPAPGGFYSDPHSANGERETLTLESPLSTEGMGPVLAGMTLREAEVRAGVKLLPAGDEVSPGCQTYTAPGLTEVSFLVSNGEIGRVDVANPDVETLSGIRVGDTEADLFDAYGTQITSEPSELNPDFNLLTFTPEDSRDDTRMIFTSDGDKITSIRAGRLPEVDYVEGCL